MFLALDIGNSHVVCAIHDAKKWIHSIRISSNLDFWNKFMGTTKVRERDNEKDKGTERK